MKERNEHAASNESTVQTAVKQKLNPTVSYYFRIIGTLFLITAVVAVLLSLVNMVTKPVIDRLAEEKRIAALSEVMPDAEFETLSQLPEGIDGLVSVTHAVRDGEHAGYCVEITVNGFGGSMNLMVGVDKSGAVTAVNILSHSETANTNRHDWLVEQYSGRSGEILTASNQSDDTHVQVISGATVTSKAVTNGVNNALRAAEACTKGGLF